MKLQSRVLVRYLCIALLVLVFIGGDIPAECEPHEGSMVVFFFPVTCGKQEYR
jgi:hypothetical protein